MKTNYSREISDINDFTHGLIIDNSSMINIVRSFDNKTQLDKLFKFDEQTEIISIENLMIYKDKSIKTIYTNKYKYVGETDHSNQRHGFGICDFRNNNLYIGQFMEGKLHGFGKIILANGEVLQGEFENNRIQGFLEHILNNESKQIITKGFPSEKGIFKYKRTSGDECINIEGEYDLNNQSTGLGRILCTEKGLLYEGELANFCSNGWGMASIIDKFIYMGQLNFGKLNGYGEIYYPDGGKFFGFYKENIKHGLSILFTSDAKVTFGGYLNNIKNGPFIIYNKNIFSIELYHHGFRSRVFERYESGKSYFRTFYPEYEWVSCINMKKIFEYFNQINPDKFLNTLVPEEKLNNCDENVNNNYIKCNHNSKKIHQDTKEISLIQKIRESMKRDMDSA